MFEARKDNGQRIKLLKLIRLDQKYEGLFQILVTMLT